MEAVFKSILDVDNGGLLEKTDYELAKVMTSLRDPNANVKKGASINVELKFKINEDTGLIMLTYETKSKLCPVEAREVVLMMKKYEDENGIISSVLTEINGQARGQFDLNGEINEPTEVMFGKIEKNYVKSEIVAQGGVKYD